MPAIQNSIEVVAPAELVQESQKEQLQNELKLQVKKLSKDAVLPVRGTEFAAGYDLFSAVDLEIPAQGKGIAKTNCAIKMPPGVMVESLHDQD